MTVRRGALLLLLAAAAAGCYTREELERPAPKPFRFQLLPYPTWDGDEGLAGHLIAGWRRGANRLPPPVAEAIEINADAAQSGTRGISVTWDASSRWPGWRFLAHGSANRFRRTPYFGIGNESVYDDSLHALYPRFYQYELLRTGLTLAAQRRLRGPVRGLVAVQARHYRARMLDTATAYARDLAAGVAADSGSSDGVELRAGLVYDTRREEASPSQGALLEAMSAWSVRGRSYRRTLLSARAFLPFGEWEQYVLAFRQTVELASDTLPFFVAYERLTTWRPEDGFGGPTSIRLYTRGRFLGDNRAVISADFRYKWVDVPAPTSPFRVWLLAFADAGRLWGVGEGPDLRGLHWSGGVGARLQFGKGGFFGIDVGSTDETAVTFAVGTVFGF